MGMEQSMPMSHRELAKHLPSDFFPRTVTGDELKDLLAKLEKPETRTEALMEFLKSHGFRVGE